MYEDNSFFSLRSPLNELWMRLRLVPICFGADFHFMSIPLGMCCQPVESSRTLSHVRSFIRHPIFRTRLHKPSYVHCTYTHTSEGEREWENRKTRAKKSYSITLPVSFKTVFPHENRGLEGGWLVIGINLVFARMKIIITITTAFG